jgi:hypothetical protein
MDDQRRYLDGTIVVARRSQDWKAYLAGHPEQWEASSFSPDDAVGKLVRSRPGELVAAIVAGGRSPRRCLNCARELAPDEGPYCTDSVGCEAERQGRLRLAEQAERERDGRPVDAHDEP